MIPSLYPYLSSDSDVTAYLGASPTRAYPHGRAPVKPTYPFVTWRLVDGVPENTLSEIPIVDAARVQVDGWLPNDGTGAATLEPLAKAVRNALQEHFSVLSYAQSPGPDPVTGSLRFTLDILVWNHR